MTGKKLLRITAVVVMSIVLLAGSGFFTATFAAQKGTAYELNDLDMTIDVNKNHSYEIKKVYKVNIPEDLDELTFEIPNDGYKIDGIDIKGVEFTTEDRGSSVAVNVDSKKYLKKGEHTFTLTYKIIEYIDTNPKNDMLYFKALSPNVSIPIGKLRVTINLPKDFPTDDFQYYAGEFGTQDVTTKLSMEQNGKSYSLTGEMIPQDFGITFKAELPEGYWAYPMDNSWAERVALGVMSGVILLLFIMWLIGGRDPKVDVEKVTHPLENFSIAEIGYIYRGHVHVKDMIALIIYLATKGYLAISEYEPKKYRLLRLEEPSDEEKFLRNAYDVLFKGVYKHRYLNMDDIGVRLRQMMKEIELDVLSGSSSRTMKARTLLSEILRVIAMLITSAGVASTFIFADLMSYRSPNYMPACAAGIATFLSLAFIATTYDSRHYSYNTMRGKLFPVALIIYLAISACSVYNLHLNNFSYVSVAAIAVCAVLAIPLVCIIPARGKDNALIVAKLEALEDFIENGDIKEINEYQEADPNYYYEILPYAALFSLAKTWAAKFDDQGIEPPAWWHDDVKGHVVSVVKSHTAETYADEITVFQRTLESEFRDMLIKHGLFH